MDVTVTDDDLGSAADSALVLITGNADVSKGHGWWLNQYRTKAPNDFTPAELQCYLDIVGALSMVFDEKTDASTYAVTGFARDLLGVADNLRRAVAALPADGFDNVRTGIEATERELLAVLARNGISKIETAGQPLGRGAVHHPEVF